MNEIAATQTPHRHKRVAKTMIAVQAPLQHECSSFWKACEEWRQNQSTSAELCYLVQEWFLPRRKDICELHEAIRPDPPAARLLLHPPRYPELADIGEDAVVARRGVCCLEWVCGVESGGWRMDPLKAADMTGSISFLDTVMHSYLSERREKRRGCEMDEEGSMV